MRKERDKRGSQGLRSPAEVADELGFSRSHVYTLADSGALPSIKIGKAVRFDPKDVERFIREHRRGKGKAA